MASFLTSDLDNKDRTRLPPVNRKSKTPVILTPLSSDSERSSSEDEGEQGSERTRTARDSLAKFRKKRLSQISLSGQKKSGNDGKFRDCVPKADELLEKDSGISLPREKMRNRLRMKIAEKRMAASRKGPKSPPSVQPDEYTRERSSTVAAKGKCSTKKVAQQRTTKLPPKSLKKSAWLEEKADKEIPTEQSYDQRSPNEDLSSESTNEVTPTFECNTALLDGYEDLSLGRDLNLSDSSLDDDFERCSVSSDEREMCSVPPWLREAVRERNRLRREPHPCKSATNKVGIGVTEESSVTCPSSNALATPAPLGVMKSDQSTYKEADEAKKTKQSCYQTSANDDSSSESTNERTPTFEYKPEMLGGDEDLNVSRDLNLSDSNLDNDFEGCSASSDESEMCNVPPWLREAVRNQKRSQVETLYGKSTLKDDQSDRGEKIRVTWPTGKTPEDTGSAITSEHKTSEMSRDQTSKPHPKTKSGEESIDCKEPELYDSDRGKQDLASPLGTYRTSVQDQTPSPINNGFDADELSKVLSQLGSMTADMTTEEQAEALLPLMMLRDETEAREKDQRIQQAEGPEAAIITPDPAQMAALEAIAQRMDAQLSDDEDSDDSLDLVHNGHLNDESVQLMDYDRSFLAQFDAGCENNYGVLSFEEAMATVAAPDPKEIGGDWTSDEISQMIADFSNMCAHMSEEEHVNALLPLLILREEARERENATTQMDCVQPEAVIEDKVVCLAFKVIPDSINNKRDGRTKEDEQQNRRNRFNVACVPTNAEYQSQKQLDKAAARSIEPDSANLSSCDESDDKQENQSDPNSVTVNNTGREQEGEVLVTQKNCKLSISEKYPDYIANFAVTSTRNLSANAQLDSAYIENMTNVKEVESNEAKETLAVEMREEHPVKDRASIASSVGVLHNEDLPNVTANQNINGSLCLLDLGSEAGVSTNFPTSFNQRNAGLAPVIQDVTSLEDKGSDKVTETSAKRRKQVHPCPESNSSSPSGHALLSSRPLSPHDVQTVIEDQADVAPFSKHESLCISEIEEEPDPWADFPFSSPRASTRDVSVCLDVVDFEEQGQYAEQQIAVEGSSLGSKSLSLLLEDVREVNEKQDSDGSCILDKKETDAKAADRHNIETLTASPTRKLIDEVSYARDPGHCPPSPTDHVQTDEEEIPVCLHVAAVHEEGSTERGRENPLLESYSFGSKARSLSLDNAQKLMANQANVRQCTKNESLCISEIEEERDPWVDFPSRSRRTTTLDVSVCSNVADFKEEKRYGVKQQVVEVGYPGLKSTSPSLFRADGLKINIDQDNGDIRTDTAPEDRPNTETVPSSSREKLDDSNFHVNEGPTNNVPNGDEASNKSPRSHVVLVKSAELKENTIYLDSALPLSGDGDANGNSKPSQSNKKTLGTLNENSLKPPLPPSGSANLKGKIKDNCRNAKDDFITELEYMLDEAEYDIRAEENMMVAVSHSCTFSNSNFQDKDDDPTSSIQAESVEGSLGSVSVLSKFENSAVAANCGDEFAISISGIADTTISKEPDSWDALSDAVPPFLSAEREESHSSYRGREVIGRLLSPCGQLLPAIRDMTGDVLEKELSGALNVMLSLREKQRNTFSFHNGQDALTIPSENATKSSNLRCNWVHQSGQNTLDSSDGCMEVLKPQNITQEAENQCFKDNYIVRQLQKELSQLTKEHFLVLDRHKDEVKSLAKAKKELKIWVEEADHRNKVLESVVESSNLEVENLSRNISDLQEQIDNYKSEKEIFKAEIKTFKLDLKTLRYNEEYKKRELSNLRNDLERKEQELERMGDDLDDALLEKQDLLYDVTSLEEDLKECKEDKEDLKWRMHVIKAELLEAVSKPDFAYLREDVELLKGSLMRSNQRKELLQSELDKLEVETSWLTKAKSAEKASQTVLQTVNDEKDNLIYSLREQISNLQAENLKIKADLSAAVHNADVGGLLQGQVDNLKTKNKSLEEQCGILKQRIEEKVIFATKECREDGRHSHNRRKGSTKERWALEQRVLHYEQEIKCLVKFIQQRGFELGNTGAQQRLVEAEQELKRAMLSIVEKDHKLDELKCVLQQQTDKSRVLKNQASEMKKCLETTKRLLVEKDVELRKKDHAFKQKSERSAELEHRVTEMNRSLEETGLRLSRTESELKKAETAVRVQTKRFVESENLVIEMEKELEKSRELLSGKENELQNAGIVVTQQAERLEELENNVNEMAGILEEARLRLSRTESELKKAEAVVREQTKRDAESEKCIIEMEKELKKKREVLSDKESELQTAEIVVRQQAERLEESKNNVNEMAGILEEARLRLSRTESELKKAEAVVREQTKRDAESEKCIIEMEKELKKKREVLSDKESELQTAEIVVRQQAERLEELENHVNEINRSLEEARLHLLRKQSELMKAETVVTVQTKKSVESENRAIEMEKELEKSRELLSGKENELQNAGIVVRQQTERLEKLENNVNEMAGILEEARLRLSRTESEMKKAEAMVRVQAERDVESENRIVEMEKELEKRREVLSDKESELQTAEIVVTRQAERLEEFEKHVIEMKRDLIETKRCLSGKESGLEKALNVARQQRERAVELENHVREIEKCLENARQASAVTESELRKEENACRKQSERAEQLENYVRDLKHSLDMKQQSLKQKENEFDRTKSELNEEKNRNKHLKEEVDEMAKTLERTIKSLHKHERELKHAEETLDDRERRVKEFFEQIEQEKIGNTRVREGLDLTRRTIKEEKGDGNSSETEICKLKKLLNDRENTVEKLNLNLQELKEELDTMRGLHAERDSGEGNDCTIPPREGHLVCDLCQRQMSRQKLDMFARDQMFEFTPRFYRGTFQDVSSLQKTLRQNQMRVEESTQLLVRARNLLDQKCEEVERLEKEVRRLRASLQDSDDAKERIERRLHELEDEAIRLRKRLCEKEETLNQFNTSMKQRQGDLERTQKSLKDKESELADAVFILQLKDSALGDSKADLCRGNKQLEGLKTIFMAKNEEVLQLRRSLKDLEKMLEHSVLVLTNKDEQIRHLESHLDWRKHDALETSLRLKQKLNELRLLESQLDEARHETENLKHVNTTTSFCLKEEKCKAEEKERALRVQIDNALEDLEDKKKVIWNMKMKLKESVVYSSSLEAEKLSVERREVKLRGKMRWYLQSLRGAWRLTHLDQTKVRAVKNDMSVVRGDNEGLRGQLLPRKSAGLIQDKVELPKEFADNQISNFNQEPLTTSKRFSR